MASAKSAVNKALTVPNKLGFNAPTAGLTLFVVTVSVASGFVLNRFDNSVTRNINSIKAGQSPVGV